MDPTPVIGFFLFVGIFGLLIFVVSGVMEHQITIIERVMEDSEHEE